jgi:hypothetical protein
MKLKVLNFLVLILISSFIISCDNDDENNECIEYELSFKSSPTEFITVNLTIN